MKTKTIEDFNKLVDKTIVKYLNDQMNFQMNYTTKREEFENGLKVFTATNNMQATKIIYDSETNHIVTRVIYISDLNIIKDMLEEI